MLCAIVFVKLMFLLIPPQSLKKTHTSLHCKFLLFKFTGSDHDTDTGEDVGSSNNVKDLTIYSAKIAVLVAFKASSMSDLSLKQHLIPLAKELKVKYRSRGKYEMLLPLAHTLFKNSYLVPAGDDITCNYLQLDRNHIKLVKKLGHSSSSPTSSAVPDTDNDECDEDEDDENKSDYNPFEL